MITVWFIKYLYIQADVLGVIFMIWKWWYLAKFLVLLCSKYVSFILTLMSSKSESGYWSVSEIPQQHFLDCKTAWDIYNLCPEDVQHSANQQPLLLYQQRTVEYNSEAVWPNNSMKELSSQVAKAMLLEEKKGIRTLEVTTSNGAVVSLRLISSICH